KGVSRVAGGFTRPCVHTSKANAGGTTPYPSVPRLPQPTKRAASNVSDVTSLQRRRPSRTAGSSR
ncbi:MAG: hypothetical protein BJ554DRAFT_5767, partial [Olpidium bornovanus]